MSEQATFETWAIVEVMGHRRLAGFVREVSIAGAGFLRVDVPSEDISAAPKATQFLRPESIYALTPCTEEAARRVARSISIAPAAVWEFPDAPKIGLRSPDDEDRPF